MFIHWTNVFKCCCMGPLADPWRDRDESNTALSSEFTSSEICKFTFAIEYDKNSSSHALKQDRNKSTCGGRCQGGLQRKSVPWTLGPPRGLKPQVEPREPTSFNAEGGSGELLKRHLEGQWGLNDGWLGGPGNNWSFLQIDFLVIISIGYLF